jgi:hypothetical protein
MEGTIAAFKFDKPADAHSIRIGTALEADAGLEYVVFNNYQVLRTLSRSGKDTIFHYQYEADRAGKFDSGKRKIFGGPYYRYSSDLIVSEIFEMLSRELRSGGL